MSPPDPAATNVAERLVPWLAHKWRGRFAVRALRLCGLDFPRPVRVGRGLRLRHHAFGLVLNDTTVIGDDVSIFQGVTIGVADVYLDADQLRPGRVVVGDRVTISANATILYGNGQTVHIGDDAVIAAGAVVLTDVPPGEIWGGVPARFLSANPNAKAHRGPQAQGDQPKS